MPRNSKSSESQNEFRNLRKNFHNLGYKNRIFLSMIHLRQISSNPTIYTNEHEKGLLQIRSSSLISAKKKNANSQSQSNKNFRIRVSQAIIHIIHMTYPKSCLTSRSNYKNMRGMSRCRSRLCEFPRASRPIEAGIRKHHTCIYKQRIAGARTMHVYISQR